MTHFIYNVPNPQLGTKTSSIYFHSFLLNSPILPIHISIVINFTNFMPFTKKEKVAINYTPYGIIIWPYYKWKNTIYIWFTVPVTLICALITLIVRGSDITNINELTICCLQIGLLRYCQNCLWNWIRLLNMKRKKNQCDKLLYKYKSWMRFPMHWIGP